MPTYEYRCNSCNHAWETEQSIKDEPLKECPECKGATAQRQISVGTGFILKGAASAAAAAKAGPPDPNEAAFHQRFEQVSGIKVDDTK